MTEYTVFCDFVAVVSFNLLRSGRFVCTEAGAQLFTLEALEI